VKAKTEERVPDFTAEGAHDTEVISSPLILDYLPDLSLYICVGIICVCYMVRKSVYCLHKLI